jgi:TRAP-type C4-dicarboxylate transport system permease small subunit
VRDGDFAPRVASALAAAFLFAIFVVILVQVFFRYVLGRPLMWTEEAARYLYIWTCYLGTAVAFRRGVHIRIGVVVDRLSPPARWVAELVGLTCTAVYLAVFLAQATELARLSHGTLAITFPLPWSAIYGAAVVSCLLMLWFTVDAIQRALRGPSGRR